jgi:hypothetical protein
MSCVMRPGIEPSSVVSARLPSLCDEDRRDATLVGGSDPADRLDIQRGARNLGDLNAR